MMRAILMAAGYGSRISRTIQKPKSTLNVLNNTIIGHSVELLINNGIEVAVVVGYRKQEIFDALKNYYVTYYFNPFFKVTNSMASLWFAREFLGGDGDVILGNADVFFEQAVLNDLLHNKNEIAMLGDKSRVTTGDYFFRTDKEGFLSSYGKELTLEERTCEYVGLAKLRRDFIPTFKSLLEQKVDEEVYNMWWENVLYENSVEHPVFIKDVDGKFWAEIDVIEDYNRILSYLRSK